MNGRKIVIEDYGVDFFLFDPGSDFLRLALADQERGIDPLAFLNHGVTDRDAGGIREKDKLVQVLLHLPPLHSSRHQSHDDRVFPFGSFDEVHESAGDGC